MLTVQGQIPWVWCTAIPARAYGEVPAGLLVESKMRMCLSVLLSGQAAEADSERTTERGLATGDPGPLPLKGDRGL